MARLTLVRGETATLTVCGHTDTEQPRVLARITPAGRLPELTADHDHACDAADMPDVAHELHVHARRTAAALGLDPDNTAILARLLDLARGSYVHGHMDASADQPDLAPATPLATVLHLRGGAS